jgi:hypothetical protein
MTHRHRILEEGTPCASRDEEDHQREAERYPEDMGQPTADTDIGTGGCQHDVVRPGRDGGHQGEYDEGEQLIEAHAAAQISQLY